MSSVTAPMWVYYPYLRDSEQDVRDSLGETAWLSLTVRLVKGRTGIRKR